MPKSGARPPSLVVLAPFLARNQAGAAQATVTIINSLQRRGKIAPTVVSFEVEDGVLDPAVEIRLAVKPRPRRAVWRLGRGTAVLDYKHALRGVSLPVTDAVYTQSLECGLAFRSLFRDVPVISHLGHVLIAREAREESDLREPWRTADAFFAETFEKRSYRSDNWTHVVSTPLVAATRARHFGLPPSFFQVQPLCVDTQRFSDRAERDATREALGMRPNDCAIVAVARMVAWKNLHWLIQSLDRLPDHCHVILVGTGVEQDALRTLAAASASSKRIHLVGHQDPVPYLAAADVFALPSAIESFGVAYAEAMCMQLPCIGLRYAPPEHLSSAQDVILDQQTGYVVGNEREFIDAVSALASNPGRRHEFAVNARSRALSRFSGEAYAMFLEESVDSLVSRT